MSERANESAQQSARAVRSKQTSKQCERTSEWTRELPSTYVPILGCSEPQCGGGGKGSKVEEWSDVNDEGEKDHELDEGGRSDEY